MVRSPLPVLREEPPGECFSFEGILCLRRAQLPAFCTSPGLTWSSGGLGVPGGGQRSLLFLHHLGCRVSPVACRGEDCAGQAGEHGEGGGRATHPVLPQWMLFQFLIFSIKHLLVLFRFGLVCICKSEPQRPESPSAASEFQDSGDRWAGRALGPGCRDLDLEWMKP